MTRFIQRRVVVAAFASVMALQPLTGIAQTLPREAAFAGDPAAAAPQPPEVAARVFLLWDLSSQQMLATRQADQPVDPAALTRLMTAYLVLQAVAQGKLDLQQEVPVSPRAWQAAVTSGGRPLVAAGGRVKVGDLLKAMAVVGAGDAALALAETVGGGADQFVDMMNRQAQVLGLKSTRFRNPDGHKASGQTSSARDLAWLAIRLLNDFPGAQPLYAAREFVWGGVRQPSLNLLLLRDPSVDGLQTSYAEGGGYGMIATSRVKTPAGERRLLSVVLGAASPDARATESQKLLNWGYSAFDAVKLYEAGQPVSQVPVWKGSSSTVPVGWAQPLVVAVPHGQAAQIKTVLVRNDPLMAPLRKGQVVATLNVSLAGQPWQAVPLQALETVSPAGWLGQAWDAFRLGIK